MFRPDEFTAVLEHLKATSSPEQSSLLSQVQTPVKTPAESRDRPEPLDRSQLKQAAAGSRSSIGPISTGEKTWAVPLRTSNVGDQLPNSTIGEAPFSAHGFGRQRSPRERPASVASPLSPLSSSNTPPASPLESSTLDRKDFRRSVDQTDSNPLAASLDSTVLNSPFRKTDEGPSVSASASGTGALPPLESQALLWGATLMGAESSFKIPTPLEFRHDQSAIVSVTLGAYIGAIVTDDGAIYTWGRAKSHNVLLLGDGTALDRLVPTLVPMPPEVRVAAVAVGTHHGVLLTDEGVVYTWGVGNCGQLGHGDVEGKAIPTQVMALKEKVGVQVAAGHAHTMVLTKDQKVFVFGDGAYGQLGQGDTASHLTPVELKLPATAKAPIHFIAAGTNHSAVMAGGELWLMGDGTPLGLKAGVHSSPTLCPIKDTTLVQVSCGAYHTMVLADNGDVYTWGGGVNLGHTDEQKPSEPRIVPSLQDLAVLGIAAGGRHSVVFADTRQVYTFGKDSFGQLGNNKGDSNKPLSVESIDNKGLCYVATGENSTAVVVRKNAPRDDLVLKFLAAEQSYLRALLLLTRVYIPTLGKLIEKEEEVKSMFSLIDPIRRLTGELFRAVHLRYLAPGTPHDKLAQSFLPLLSPVYGAPASCPHMETLYLEFCKAHTRAFPWLERQRSVAAFQQLMIDLKKKAGAPLHTKKNSAYDQKRHESMDLYTLLSDIKHRAHHYLTFLQRYRELSPPRSAADPDHTELNTALDCLSALSTQISYDQNLSELTALVARVRRLDTLLSPSRTYLGNANVKLQGRTGTEDQKTLILFDDQLVVAAADKLEAQLPLETLWVMPTQTDLNANHTFSFISPEKRLLVFAETNAIMDGFVTKVESAIRAWLEKHDVRSQGAKRCVTKLEYRFRNDSRYTGDWELAKPTGKGAMTYPSGDKYEGEFLAGFRDGYGTMIKKSGDKYEGNWSNDRKQGSGIYYYAKVAAPAGGLPNAEKYTGEFVDDKFQGKGELLYDNGMIVKGYWKASTAAGIMTVTYPNGDVYAGEWANGRPNGYGHMLSRSDDVYFGIWVTGQAATLGHFICNDGTEFYGEWKSGKIEGKGTLYFPNKTSITGTMKGLFSDNSLTVSGTFKKEDDKSLLRKRLMRWESLLGTRKATRPDLLRPLEEQLKASITSAAPDTNTLILNILKQPESHAVAAAVNDYISMFTGTYGAPTEKSGKSVPRVVEEITSVLVAAGSAFVRSVPELNTESGLQWTWDAFEQFIFPRIYSTLFPLIVRKHELDDSAVQTSLLRFRRLPPVQQLLLVGVDNAVATPMAEAAEAIAVLQRAAETLAGIANAKNPAEKLHCLVGASRDIEAATKLVGRTELGADDFLPLFTFVCAVSPLRNLHAECYFIDTFMSEGSRTSLPGYLFINLVGASKVLAELDKKEQRRRASVAALLPEKHP